MKQFNLMRAVGFAVVFALPLLGMTTKAEAHAGNTSASVIHACKGNVLGLTRIVGVNGVCSNLESAVHWDIVGPAGATGPAGVQGAVGPEGPAGLAGAVGAVGPAGATGPMGLAGATGPAGAQGPTGAAGPIGATGPAGAVGPAGTVGAVGPAGAIGLAGPVGAIGPQGLIGPIGPQGPPAPVGPTYIIGDLGPSGTGNIVAYVDGSGEHGLEAKTADETTTLVWAAAVTAAEAYNSPSCPTAALRTPSCWHLPTKTELELLYEQKNVVGGFANINYWSSTENGAVGAWNQLFNDGFQDIFNKNVTLRVRAVRAF